MPIFHVVFKINFEVTLKVRKMDFSSVLGLLHKVAELLYICLPLFNNVVSQK